MISSASCRLHSALIHMTKALVEESHVNSVGIIMREIVVPMTCFVMWMIACSVHCAIGARNGQTTVINATPTHNTEHQSVHTELILYLLLGLRRVKMAATREYDQ